MREHLDPETLAAFIDGGLTPDERARVLEVLAKDPDAITYAASVVRVERHMSDVPDERARHLALVPDSRRSAPKVHTWRIGKLRTPAVVLAACVTMVIGVRSVLSPEVPQDDEPGWLPDAASIRSAATAPSAAHAGWGSVRAGAEVLSQEALAVRLGVRSADLWDAAALGEWSAAMALADSLTLLARRVEGGDVIADQLREQVTQARASADDYTTLLQRLAARTHAESWYEVGRWIEASRLSAERGDAHFLPAIARARAAALELPVGNPSLATRLQTIAADYRDPVRKGATREHLAVILEELAR